jgi:hypothetical protein
LSSLLCRVEELLEAFAARPHAAEVDLSVDPVVLIAAGVVEAAIAAGEGGIPGGNGQSAR